MAAKTDQKARLLDLITGILELTRDGDREYEPVSDVLQVIKEKKNFADILLRGMVETISNIFKIICKGSHTTSELIKLGKYYWGNDWITDKRFPLEKHASTTRNIELVEFDHDPTSEEVLEELTRRGLDKPTYEDALCFGIQHPEEQRKHPIVFLHNPVFDPFGNRGVLVLDEHSGLRGLSLRWFDYGWGRCCVFAGVGK